MDKKSPYISVIICTYNKSGELKNALNSLSAAVFPEDAGCEIIVIDNNSSDDTREVARVFSSAFGNGIRYFFEQKQGISYARNRGIKEARGEFVAFIDDDVIVDRNWIIEVVKNLKSLDTDCLAGKVLPKWEMQKPRWMTPNLGKALGLLDYGDKPYRISSLRDEIVTANFIARKIIFDDESFLFKTSLGDKGKRIVKGEDTELFFNLMREGRRIWYCPSCVVYHVIPRKRMTVSYFLRWSYQHSLSKVYLTEMFPGFYDKKELRVRMMDKLWGCIKSINISYVELLSGLFFYTGLIAHRFLRFLARL